MPKKKTQPKPSPSSSSSNAPSKEHSPPLPPPPLAQPLLDAFAHAFRPTLTGAEFAACVQEAKAALYERDFARAFARPEVLHAYAARWSPTRAGCYARVLGGVLEGGLGGGKGREGSEGQGQDNEGQSQDDQKDHDNHVRVLAYGGATAELAALAAWVGADSNRKAHVELVDMAPWQSALETLYSSLTTTLPPTPYVPAPLPPLAAPAALTYTFTQADALTLSDNNSTVDNSTPADIITLLFTLNELYTTSVGRTTAFLLSLAQRVKRPGGLLVVVDSPGSYAETSVGKEGDKRRYPMQWLLDRTLLGEGAGWEKVDGRESVWFRWGEKGRYLVPLEDMRFQVHVYRARGL